MQLASVLDNAVLMLSSLVTPCVRCNLKDNFKVELIYCPDFIVWQGKLLTKGYCFVIENFSTYSVIDCMVTRFGLVSWHMAVLVTVMLL